MSVSYTSGVAAPTFTAGGLASGLDTNSIVDKLVSLESQPITDLQTQESNTNIQISALADIISSVQALDTAASDLSQNGVYAAQVTSSNTAFSGTAGTGATPGRYSVEVQATASAASWRSDAFLPTDTVAAGTLTLTVGGKPYPPPDANGVQTPITIDQGDTLADVAYKIRASGAPVSAAALTDSDGNSYLSITDLATGKPLDGSAALALQFTRDGAATGKSLDAGIPTLKDGANATVLVDGLKFVRSTNAVNDIIPGVTLNLAKAAPGAPEDLVIATDTAGTQARLQKFVDAYNGVMSLVQRQLNVTKDTNRATTLAGDPAMRDVQSRLQSLIVSQVPGLGGISTLADVGLKTAQDGSLSIDADRLGNALASSPNAVNALFSTQGTGLADVVDSLVQTLTQTGTGILTADQDGLKQNVDELDTQISNEQARVDAYRQTLLAQFTAMETTVSGLKSMGTFLTNQFASWSSTGK